MSNNSKNINPVKLPDDRLSGTSYSKLLETLNSQLKGKNWGELVIEQSVKDDCRYIKIPNESVGFCFTLGGEFLGMYNWKD